MIDQPIVTLRYIPQLVGRHVPETIIKRTLNTLQTLNFIQDVYREYRECTLSSDDDSRRSGHDDNGWLSS